MKGTILAPGTISGFDGKRYGYESSDIRNPEITASAGMQVDFEIAEDGRAKDIFLTPVNLGVAYAVHNDAVAVRTKAIVAIILGWLLVIPFVGFICLIVSLVLWIMVYSHISKVTGIKGFFLLIIGGVLLSLIGAVVALVGAAGSVFGGADADMFSGMAIMGMIIAFASSVCYLMINFKLARATGVGLFKISGILKLFSFIPLVGIIIALVAAVLEIIAWVNTDKLIRPTEA